MWFVLRGSYSQPELLLMVIHLQTQ